MLFLINSLPAQGIRGTIQDQSGEPLPFASLYVLELKDGASTNINGAFEIKLPKGKYTILAQYIGYKPIQVQLELEDEWLEHHFTLEEQAFVLEEVEVKAKASNEDPAYTIMRKAIAKRKYHLLQYDSYKMTVYMKGTSELKDVPFFLKNKIEKEGVQLNEAYTSESVSEILFEQPNKIEERVISIRSTGSNEGSPSPSLFITQPFYQNEVAEVVSPLSQRAFSYYRFRYEGASEEDGLQINKIKVIPRSRGEQVFEGYIYIIEDLWAIHSLDLQTSRMGFKIHVKQNYAEVAPATWMPVTHQYLISGKMLGFEIDYRYLASSSNFQVKLNPDLLAQPEIIDEKIEEVPEGIKIEKVEEKDEIAEILSSEERMTRRQFRKIIKKYEKEALAERKEPEVVSERNYHIDSLAAKRGAAYWESIRPVPLSKKEQEGYRRDDSLSMVESARLTGIDSAGVIPKNHFKVQDILLGGSYNLSPRTSLKIKPTLAHVNFNTVEGVNIGAGLRIRHSYDSLRRRIEFTPSARYGFSSEKLYGKAGFSYRHKKGNRQWSISLEGGSFIEQYNEDEPIHPYVNTLSTLLFRQNYIKIFEKQYALLGYNYQPSSWLKLYGNLEWAHRSPLFNHTNYSFFYKDERAFSPNAPLNQEVITTFFPEHKALILEAEVSYRPFQRYRLYNGRKIPLRDKSPEFLLKYRKGIKGVLGSKVNFDHLEAGVIHGFSFGVRGNLAIELRGGTFLNNSEMYFMDYQHFPGNQTILSSLQPVGAYRLLDYYRYSTNNPYVSAFIHYQFRKFLLTQLPLLRFSGLRENVFFNYLKTEVSPHYYEVGYSMDRIFQAFRLDFAVSFTDGGYQQLGLRIGIATSLGIEVAED
ncbi:DUF5686 and carboxypeptidase regulatory-like domain-containing protein [Nafulsella turpanensis]|uniref:DUF5686 and carboxypeptidase regulatory-like domain-containing protein n=1 Tax=Nafulsella turpanensis TaxID=1265690 RepID=UPI001F42048F|nr:DUF5686 family protein [Nafulsella turpanensis]